VFGTAGQKAADKIRVGGYIVAALLVRFSELFLHHRCPACGGIDRYRRCPVASYLVVRVFPAALLAGVPLFIRSRGGQDFFGGDTVFVVPGQKIGVGHDLKVVAGFAAEAIDLETSRLLTERE